MTQAGVGCNYTLDAYVAERRRSGWPPYRVGDADTGCAWTAVSDNTSWMTVTGGSSGTGNGTVSYTVAANTTTSSRPGTLTIAGQTLNVMQAGVCSSP